MGDADSPRTACRRARRDASAADAVLAMPGTEAASAAVHLVRGWLALLSALGLPATRVDAAAAIASADLPGLDAERRARVARGVEACVAAADALERGESAALGRAEAQHLVRSLHATAGRVESKLR